ncbi:hypothetical protein ACJVDH_05730 [Pedobacter sp. AW1-32]|uniref:hypothetical protein n=1 Tax=Pedobacter sp. AW1-32 TaxID=3383026 RepID=UPI003FEE25AD
MWQTLDIKRKRIILVVAALAILYIAYLCSFKAAISAYTTNRQLANPKTETVSESVLSQVEQKHKFYQQILKKYRTRKEDRESRIWQSISAMAMANNVEISFKPKKLESTAEVDSTTLVKGSFESQFNLKGKYANLVRLLDTLSKSEGIGRISKLSISEISDNGQRKTNDQLSAELSLRGLDY